MFRTWTYTQYGETHGISVDSERRMFIRSESSGYGMSLDNFFGSDGSIYCPADIRREIFLALAEEPEHTDAKLPERWTLRFWKRFHGAREQETLLPAQHFFVHAAEHAIGCRYQNKTRHGDMTYELWTDWLWNGNRIPGLSLEFRKEYRQMLLDTVAELKPEVEQLVFPLIDYSLLPQRTWREEQGIEGDVLTFQADGVYIEGWDNPRDGGCQTISYEQLYLHPDRYTYRHIRKYQQEIIECLREGIVDPIALRLPSQGGWKRDA